MFNFFSSAVHFLRFRSIICNGHFTRLFYFDKNTYKIKKCEFSYFSTAPSTADDSAQITITDRAIERLKRISGEGKENEQPCLRVLVDSGGCSGFEYKFQLVSGPEKDDRIFEKDGVRVVVDDLSLDFLRGATVDYQEELIKSAFRVVQNPRAEKGCSCGSSFSLKTKI